MAVSAETWLLPDGVQDVLPREAARLEALRRRLLDQFAAWGYQLVFPPLMEFLDSLLTGSGHDLDLMTFKITDQISGRLMGVRADITPQVARLDAHCLPTHHTARYCYAGTVLNTRSASLAASRAPIQIGAELFGYGGVAADIEIIRLMLATLETAGVHDIHLDIGHVGIFRALAREAGLTSEDEAALFDIYQRKSLPELQDLHARLPRGEWFLALGDLSGGAEQLDRACHALSGAPEAVAAALSDVRAVIHTIREIHPGVRLSVDLCELRGYNYHTGLVFAAYAPDQAVEIAKGGRYDHVGESFGRSRPATGFSADLKALLGHDRHAAPGQVRVLAPVSDDAGLQVEVARLRAAGHVVIQSLPGEAAQPEVRGCNRCLVLRDGGWVIEDILSGG